jgi:hypothetical protein
MITRSNGYEVTLNQHNLPKNSELSEQYECTHATKESVTLPIKLQVSKKNRA